jgi:hypothetical protein
MSAWLAARCRAIAVRWIWLVSSKICTAFASRTSNTAAARRIGGILSAGMREHTLLDMAVQLGVSKRGFTTLRRSCGLSFN